MAGGIAGSVIGIKVNGSFISCELSATLNFKNNNLAASAVTSGGWKEFIYGIREWSMTVDGQLLLDAVPSDIKAIITTGFINQFPMFVEFATRESSAIQMILSGIALLDSGNMAAPGTGVATWSATFQGSGPLGTTYLDYDLLIDAMPSEADYPIIVDEST